jgi:hypothetical protein
MTDPDFTNEEEPLRNIDLESAVLGLKMALTYEEESEARRKFLNVLRESTLAVPMMDQGAPSSNGAKPADHDIQLIVAENVRGINGVPAFTTVACLRDTIPRAQSCTFLKGAQLAAMLAESPFMLFVDGPDLHAEVDHVEMKAIVAEMEAIVAQQQEAALHNAELEDALVLLSERENNETAEAVAAAFMGGHCCVPLAGEGDDLSACIVLTAAEDAPEGAPTQLALMTRNEALLCFTSPEKLNFWSDTTRDIVPFPGQTIVELANHAGVTKLQLNAGSPDGRTLLVGPERVTVARS